MEAIGRVLEGAARFRSVTRAADMTFASNCRWLKKLVADERARAEEMVHAAETIAIAAEECAAGSRLSSGVAS
jgi:hypothetical protein